MSVADTAITLVSAPGNSGGDFGPALPAAAIRMIPSSLSFLIACCRIGSRGPAKLILMILAPCATAHSRPLTMFMLVPCAPFSSIPKARRSEEHTSELQSQSNLVCRLLLEKKKRLTHD